MPRKVKVTVVKKYQSNDPVNHLDDDEKKWFAVRTNYKREKIVRDQLIRLDIEAFLPLQEKTIHYTRKTVRREIPLLYTYIFVKIIRSEYVPVLQVPQVYGFTKLHRDLISIPEEEIDILKRVIGAKVDVTIEKDKIATGDPVRVSVGQFAGMEGEFVQTLNSHKFLIELKALGHFLRMEIDESFLDRL